MNVAVLPAVLALPASEQRATARRVIFGPERLMIGAALLAAALGVVRGIAFGPIRTFEALTTPYGAVWMLAIAITISVFFIGARVTGPTAHTLLDDDDLWTASADLSTPGARANLLDRLRRAFRLELMGILAVFALMPILRFL
jgi:hypothetical protein